MEIEVSIWSVVDDSIVMTTILDVPSLQTHPEEYLQVYFCANVTSRGREGVEKVLLAIDDI